MKNIVIFDVRGESSCACVTNIYERGVNTIVLAFEADIYKNPKYEIMVGESSTLHDLSVENDVAFGLFDWWEIFNVENPPSSCQIRYVDGDKVGNWFKWSLTTTTVPDGMIEAGFRTLRVFKTSITNFEIQFVSSALVPISAANPDDFEVDDGEISLKNVTDINVKENTNNQITSVEIVYEDETAEIYECKYNADGDLISFGDINVDRG